MKKCPHCGAKMVEYKHSLTKAQIRPLAKLAKAGGGPLNITDDLNLTKSEYTNFAKLAYWGLVKQEGNSERGGNWQITEKGWGFVKGLVGIRKQVIIYRGNLVKFLGDFITIQQVTGGWQYRPQYIRESQPHG